MGAERENLEPLVARLPLAHDLRRAEDEFTGGDLDDVVVELEAAGAGGDRVDLLDVVMVVAEAQPPAGLTL